MRNAPAMKVVKEGLERYPVDLLCYCLMSNAAGGVGGWPVDGPRKVAKTSGR